MLPKNPLPQDYLIELFRSTVLQGQSIEGHLLSKGEHYILKTFLSLETDAQHVYARLHSRRRQPVREDAFSPPGIASLAQNLKQLEDAGFIDRGRRVPRAQRQSAMRVEELKFQCKREGLPATGRRGELLARIQHLDITGGPKVIRIRHGGLFRRLLRSGLQDHRGDLTKSVLHELGVSHSAVYTTTQGVGRFQNRTGMRAYEAAIDRHQIELEQTASVEKAEALLRDLERIPPSPEYRFRFSAKRFLGDLLRHHLRGLERTEHPGTVSELYNQAILVNAHQAGHYRRRLALVEDRRGNSQLAVAICKAHKTNDPESFGIHRTGARIARKCGQPYPAFATAPPLNNQQLTLPWPRKKSLWHHPSRGPLRIEDAVIEWLKLRERTALYAEGRLWSTLFGLIYSTALFAPVTGMLPCPHLNKPLDFGTPTFRRQRKREIEKIKSQVLQTGASSIIQSTWTRRHKQNIAGVSWQRWSLSQLCAAADCIGRPVLLQLLDPFLDQGLGAAKGLPDLLILPGPEVSTDPFFLGSGSVFAEIKGPGDSIRDAQRWWIQRMRAARIDPQIWHVRPISTK